MYHLISSGRCVHPSRQSRKQTHPSPRVSVCPCNLMSGSFLVKCLFRSFVPFLKCGFFFPYYWVLRVFKNIFWNQFLYHIWDLQIFSPGLWLVYSFTSWCLYMNRGFQFKQTNKQLSPGLDVFNGCSPAFISLRILRLWLLLISHYLLPPASTVTNPLNYNWALGYWSNRIHFSASPLTKFWPIEYRWKCRVSASWKLLQKTAHTCTSTTLLPGMQMW